MIALPLHGQNTAAVELVVTGQAGPPILGCVAGGDVFGKQARLAFAEFLSLLLVFPLIAHQCGGNDGLIVGFSWSRCNTHYSLGLSSLIANGRSGLAYTCAWRRSGLLVTHFSIVSPMWAWAGLIIFRGVRFLVGIINLFLSEL